MAGPVASAMLHMQGIAPLAGEALGDGEVDIGVVFAPEELAPLGQVL